MNMTVLLIDDSDVFRARLRRHLEAEPGLAVIEARNGPDGLIAIERQRPDAVVLDLHMPGMDGFSVLAQIRARHGALKVIVLSANLTAAARLQCNELRADALVDKTDTASTIVSAIQDATGAAVQEGA